MDIALRGQRVLITGGSSGIGLAIAERLGRAGAATTLVARGGPALAEAMARVPGARGFEVADVSDAAAIRTAVASASGRLGGLDVVVVGAAAAAYGPFREMEPDDYVRTVQTTLLGAMNTAHAAIPMLAASRGTLVLVGSVAGRVPVPWLAAYAAAKHGVRGFARSLAGELRAQRVPVRVALVSPGPVDTRFWQRVRTPDGRLPPEISGAYRAQDVAAEVELALRGGWRLERTVGGLMAMWATADAVVPNLTVRAMGPVASLGWRRRERRPASPSSALEVPLETARGRGGLSNRPSFVTRARELVSRASH